MKKLLIVTVLFSAAFVSCKSAKNIKSYSDVDSVAYAKGVYWGNNLKRDDSTMNLAIFFAGVSDAYAGKEKMDMQAAVDFLNEYYGVRLPAKAKAEGEAYLEDVRKKNPNIRVTDSGLLYEIIDEGDMSRRATDNADQVLVNYKGTLKDGTVFDQNDSLKFALNRVIRGWTEGMKLVGPGGKITLWVPADLGYGERPQGQIPANSVLMFDVDLIDVIPAEAE